MKVKILSEDERSIKEQEKTGLRIEPGRPFVFGEERLKKKTSSLDYPITVLESERDDIHRHPADHLDQLQRAIDILTEEKYKRVKEEFKKEVEEKKKREPIPYVKR